jgi:hypothetical protein
LPPAPAVLAGATAARADGVPGLRGHDHTGITVPDIKQAADFFINVLGCKEAMSFGPFADEKGNFMADLLNVDPRAVIHQITLVRCGYGSTSSCFNTVHPTRRPLRRRTVTSAAITSPSMSTTSKRRRTISTARA